MEKFLLMVAIMVQQVLHYQNGLKSKKKSKFYIIIGMMKNKNIEEFLKPLNSYINKLVAINIPLEKILRTW